MHPHDASRYELQLHDDLSAFTMSTDQTGALYTATNPDGSYYGYYPDQQYGLSHLMMPPLNAPPPTNTASILPAASVANQSPGTATSKATPKRPLKPASSSGASASGAGGVASSSHVRTLPVKSQGVTVPVGTTNFGNVANQSAFINKLYTMLEEADDRLISWDETGTFFIVKNTQDFSKLVLPLYFKHNNFASFVRQLNMYGFHKINDSFFKLNSTCSEVWEFKHHDFRRGEFALLSNIKRKAPKSSSNSTKQPKGERNNTAGSSTYTKKSSTQNNNNTTTSSSSSAPTTAATSTTAPNPTFPHNPMSSIASSPLCLMTPNLSVGMHPFSTPGANSMKMESCGDLLAGWGSMSGFDASSVGGTMMGVHGHGMQGHGMGQEGDGQDVWMARVCDLEAKVATLSDSYEMVCNEALACKRELADYSSTMAQVVSVLATMAAKDPANSDLISQIAKLGQSALALGSNSTTASSGSASSTQLHGDADLLTFVSNTVTTGTTPPRPTTGSKKGTAEKRKHRATSSRDSDDLDASFSSDDEDGSSEEELTHRHAPLNHFNSIDTIMEEDEETANDAVLFRIPDKKDSRKGRKIATPSAGKGKGSGGGDAGNASKFVNGNGALSLMTPPIGNRGKVPSVQEVKNKKQRCK
ncbi:hypothetical protein HDU98_002166 [Podochytrium sp. JEL0797]|nr:hypothetical protein HDU98_002166 [Podochytrium sp. JEL0797]